MKHPYDDDLENRRTPVEPPSTAEVKLDGSGLISRPPSSAILEMPVVIGAGANGDADPFDLLDEAAFTFGDEEPADDDQPTNKMRVHGAELMPGEADENLFDPNDAESSAVVRSPGSGVGNTIPDMVFTLDAEEMLEEDDDDAFSVLTPREGDSSDALSGAGSQVVSPSQIIREAGDLPAAPNAKDYGKIDLIAPIPESEIPHISGFATEYSMNLVVDQSNSDILDPGESLSDDLMAPRERIDAALDPAYGGVIRGRLGPGSGMMELPDLQPDTDDHPTKPSELDDDSILDGNLVPGTGDIKVGSLANLPPAVQVSGRAPRPGANWYGPVANVRAASALGWLGGSLVGTLGGAGLCLSAWSLGLLPAGGNAARPVTPVVAPGPATAAAVPPQVRDRFWDAVKSAETQRYSDALRQLKATRDAYTGGQAAVNEKDAEVFGRCCDELQTAWELRAELKKAGYSFAGDQALPALNRLVGEKQDLLERIKVSDAKATDAVAGIKEQLTKLTGEAKQWTADKDKVVAEVAKQAEKAKLAEAEKLKLTELAAAAERDRSAARTALAGVTEALKSAGTLDEGTPLPVAIAKLVAAAKTPTPTPVPVPAPDDRPLREARAALNASRVEAEALRAQLAKGVPTPAAVTPAVAVSPPATTPNPAVAIRAFNAGLRAFQNGDLATAEAAFTLAVREGDDDARYHYYLGLCRYRQGRTSEAEGDFRKGAELERAYTPAPREVNASLERIQGGERAMLAAYRR